jgi:hypothetical protein
VDNYLIIGKVVKTEQYENDPTRLISVVIEYTASGSSIPRRSQFLMPVNLIPPLVGQSIEVRVKDGL